jgi:hypothetical protein
MESAETSYFRDASQDMEMKNIDGRTLILSA